MSDRRMTWIERLVLVGCVALGALSVLAAIAEGSW